jgi:uncharacterized membrane protein
MSGINNAGNVAGYGYNGMFFRAFIGSISGSTLIPLPPGWASAQGYAINNVGQVAGSGGPSNDTTTYQAFIGTGSGASIIPLPSGWSASDGVAINDAGQVAGFVCNNACGHTQAFIGTLSVAALIPNPSGYIGYTQGRAINSSGQVAATAITPFQAFIGTVLSASLIPVPNGGYAYATIARGINDFGLTVGDAFVPATVIEQGFIGTPSGSMLIPLPTGASSSNARAINDSGVVVGDSNVGAWEWSASTRTRLLNTMVPTQWNLSNAMSISQNGRILAYGSLNGGASQFVELIPVGLPTTPAPRTGLLVIAGLLLVVAWRFRHRLLA